MIAAIENAGALCVVKWTGRVKLHAGIVTYCNTEANAADGVLQVPDQVFTKALPFTIQPGQTVRPCSRCRTAVLASIA